MTDKEVWAKRFLDLANELASWSEDRDFHVGAVIVGPNHEIRATGYNGLPRGVGAQDDRRSTGRAARSSSGSSTQSATRFTTRRELVPRLKDARFTLTDTRAPIARAQSFRAGSKLLCVR
jgi:deoxycytidylate deaminase